ncbi:nuclear polyadenylated RNA-binding protein NAB2, putative [Plasmodium yoelii]|nr:nuclear polyadenylated RNA-binding protein NAB2, putative [Plasmodium yoelii]CDU18922.1 coronin binding protein, putative [Plasmodium yoelii]VTZ79507.1 nuclear polyadenylated RNA-binding protein NAB2, putative [Plasmodium yoelii]|eukprot:XP_022812408.1 nuclear polyadenylated RNA-binding protein NAB2, putative [Plasmodium yoelii]
MISNNTETDKKYQNIITEKLRELLGEYEVDILTEYVWHMAGNSKSSSEFMCNELKDFLGDHTTVFVDWLLKLIDEIKKNQKDDNLNDEKSRSNKSPDSRSKQSLNQSKKSKSYLKDYDSNKRNNSRSRRGSKSIRSSSDKYSNNDSDLFSKKYKKRQREISIRSNSSKIHSRKFHYDRNQPRRRLNDNEKYDKKIKLREKDRTNDKSYSRSLSPNRKIYVEKKGGIKKGNKEYSYSDGLRSNTEMEERKNSVSDEYNNLDKKNKAILKPNPRFGDDKTFPFLQPASSNLNPQEMPNYVMNRNYPYDKGMNFEGKYYQGNYMVSQPNILDGNVNNPNNSYMANNVNNNYFNPPNPNHYNNNMQQKNMIPQPGFAHTNKFQNNMNSNNYSYPKNNIMNVNAKNNNTLNFGNPNNNNMYLNNQKNQEQFHIQKFNKQIHFNKSFVNSDKSPIKPQNTHTTQPIISNVWINQNANNMTNNSDKNNITNSQINDQLPNTQNTNLQDETKLNHINDGTTNVAIAGGNQMVNQDGVVDPANTVVKIPKKCLYLPNCQFGDKCRYIHPVENCRNWPYCAFGSECIYIHPNVPCKFGAYCANYYCNYSHDHVDTSNMPEIGTNGYFLNKKLINNTTQNTNSESFDNKVAQISISMPKTPPEMKKDKNKSEYNENEYIQGMLEAEKQELNNLGNNNSTNNDYTNNNFTNNDYTNNNTVELQSGECTEGDGNKNNNLINLSQTNVPFTINKNNLGNLSENNVSNYNCFNGVTNSDKFNQDNLPTDQGNSEHINNSEN